MRLLYSGIMSNRHKTPRVLANDSQKRKLQAERIKKFKETLAKTPKLTNFFTSSNKEEIPQDSKKTVGNSTVDGDLVNSVQDHSEAKVSSSNGIQFSIIESELRDEARFCGHKNDKGLWPSNITKGMIEYWAKKGSTEL
uniref:Uncharacterized protein n=1 Tax=Sipha flava TaxID=143950 RepID=A0A2S2QC60_9HEMI